MLEQGRVLGNYRIHELLGRGGMGVVYKATQISLDRTVALKILGADVSADTAFASRFRREGVIQAKLDHPNIVTVFEAGELDDHLFIAMRLVRGPTLKQMIASQAIEPARALRLLGPLADALDTAHEAGLIHRDVKPQNILVGPNDHPHLADFGLMKSGSAPTLTRTGQFVGSVHYTAPEQIVGGAVGPRADIYALGAVLFEALTGELPFRRENHLAVLYAHLEHEPPRVSEHRPDLPAALDEVIAAAMAKKPEDRPATAAELMRSAERAFGENARGAVALPSSMIAAAAVLSGTSVNGRLQPAVGHANSGAAAGSHSPTALPAGVASIAPARAMRVAPSTPAPAALPRTAHASAAQASAAQPPTTQPTTATPPRSPIRAVATSAAVAAAPGAGDRSAALRRGPSRAWVAVAPVLLALGVGGYAEGRSGALRKRPTPPSIAAAGGLEVDVPAGWARAHAPDLPGLTFAHALALSPRGRTDRGLVAGVVADAVGRDLLPKAFAGRLSRATRGATSVSMGRLQALRYKRLPVGTRTRLATLYAVPTSGGAAVVACYEPASASATNFEVDCDRAAATLRVTGTRTYDLAPSSGYAAQLTPLLARLSRDRRRLRKALSHASTPARQASAAHRLAAATRRAERDLGAVTVSARDREAHDRLGQGLTAARGGYDHMAAAARSGRSSRFTDAAAEVRRADATVRGALAALARLGYPS